MTAHFTLTLDTAPPASPTLSINGGADRTGDQVVTVVLATPSADVQEMKVWGDLDPTADGRFQVDEEDSTWTLWSPEIAVRLSAGTGRKHLFARLKDDVCNETPAFTDWIDLDLASPVVAITNPPDRTRISVSSPCNTVTFSWEANRPFDRYEVRLVPTTGSPHLAGVPLAAADGSWAAQAPLTTALTGTDIQTASPGDGQKVVKVFVRDLDGVWSA